MKENLMRGLGVLACGLPTVAKSDEPSVPYNIVFVTTDQEHFFSEFPDGSDYEARKLLQEMGVTFEKHYCCANMSTSSRSVIYTGTHITQTKMFDNTDLPWQASMSQDLTTLGDRLTQAGYYCAYKGKWHLCRHDEPVDLEKYGFKDWGGHDYSGMMHEGHVHDPEFADQATNWLAQTGAQLNAQGRPFFLAVNFINPHDIMEFKTDPDRTNTMYEVGYEPDDPVYETTYADALPSTSYQDLTSPGVVQAVRRYKSCWESSIGGFPTNSVASEISRKRFQRYYYNCIQDNDNSLLKVVRAIRDDPALRERTIIILTADHGEMQGAHNLKGKGGFVYENNIHVPLVVVHPAVSAKARVNVPTSHIDLLPTVIDLAATSSVQKAEVGAGLPGNSLKPLLFGSTEPVRDGALFCYQMLSIAADLPVEGGAECVDAALSNRSFVVGIVTDRYKFARYFDPLHFQTPTNYADLVAGNDIELYDLDADAEEVDNLTTNPANEELVMELNARLNALIGKEIGEDCGEYFKNFAAELKKGKLDEDTRSTDEIADALGVTSLNELKKGTDDEGRASLSSSVVWGTRYASTDAVNAIAFAESSSSAFQPNGAAAEAYLLNCPVPELERARSAFRIPAFAVDADGNVSFGGWSDGAAYRNGTLRQLGAKDVTGSFTPGCEDARFFRFELVK